MLKIVTLYAAAPKPTDTDRIIPLNMAYGRWFKISQALAELGHTVHMAIPDSLANNLGNEPWPSAPKGIPMLGLSEVKWDQYDVVKTEFHKGFDALEAHGGLDHPFIVSKLGSVVGAEEMEGIYFYGDIHKRLYDTQVKIQRHSRFVTVLSQPAIDLWEACFGRTDNLLLVPGAADRNIPAQGADPFPDPGVKRCLFAGNVYDETSQPEANRVLVDKLNQLGHHLADYGIRLYMVGNGDLNRLDQDLVTYLGAVPLDQCWAYMQHADVGAVVSAGSFMHNNESTKIYHYLRAGLPMVSESGFPNDKVATESRLGAVVPSGDIDQLAAAAAKMLQQSPEQRRAGADYILQNHTWDHRAQVYQRLFEEHFA